MKKLLLIFLFAAMTACYSGDDQTGEYDEPVTVEYQNCEGTTANGRHVECVFNISITPDLEEAREKAYAHIADLRRAKCTSSQIVWDNLQCTNKSVTVP